MRIISYRFIHCMSWKVASLEIDCQYFTQESPLLGDGILAASGYKVVWGVKMRQWAPTRFPTPRDYFVIHSTNNYWVFKNSPGTVPDVGKRAVDKTEKPWFSILLELRKIKQKRGFGVLGVGQWVVNFNRVIREKLTEKLTFEQRPQGGGRSE